MGDGGHLVWGGKARYDWDKMYKDFPDAGLETLEPENLSFDYGKQVVAFIRERDPSQMSAIRLTAAAIAALGLAATI